jgi:hypothetical protein
MRKNSMSDQYASFEEEPEQSALDFGFLPPSAVQGPYTSTVQNIVNRQNIELRGATETLLQPLHQISRRRIRELVAKQNNELFQFLQHPDRSPTTLGIAETIFRKFGQEAPLRTNTNYSITRDLRLDMSMNSAVQEIEEGMRRAMDTSGSILGLGQQLKWLFNQYKHVGDEVMRLEALLTQKTEVLDKLHQRQNLITSLKNNEALPELLDSFHKYMETVFKESTFETTYLELSAAYKKWNILREFVSVQTLTDTEHKEPLCAICLTDPITHTVAPCGHTFCTTCVRRLNVNCYLCRGAVRERVKLYFT